MQLVDSHSHIDFNEFDNDRSLIIDRASRYGVSDIIVSATIAKRWLLISQLCEKYEQCHAAYGLHPMFIDEHKKEHLNDLHEILKTKKVVAVGEIGLDYFIDEAKDNSHRELQLDLFISQLTLADELNLPVIIHARKSLDIVLKYLRKFPNITGSIHSFSGSEQQARQLIDLGFYLGFGGPITYTRATKLRKLVATLPLESLLLETDAPDQPDALHYKQRNEPAYLLNVAQSIAELRNIEVNEVALTTTKNAQTLYKNMDIEI